MKTKNLIVALALLATAGVISISYFKNKVDLKTSSNIKKENAAVYWTCPMHPQIHQDHPGECPICHMKLVQVKSQKEDHSEHSNKLNQRSSVQFTGRQAELLGIQKHEVEKMDLTARIPVSGRVLSSSAVALQIYEDDLRYIRPGLPFRGEVGNGSDRDVTGTIASVDNIADPTSRTIRVVGNIKNGPRYLITESSFRGEIQIDLKDRIAIPESSVLHTGSGDLVYIFTDENKVSPKIVKLGMKTQGYYEVFSGLNPGDQISSGPNFLIDSEAKIRGTND